MALSLSLSHSANKPSQPARDMCSSLAYSYNKWNKNKVLNELNTLINILYYSLCGGGDDDDNDAIWCVHTTQTLIVQNKKMQLKHSNSITIRALCDSAAIGSFRTWHIIFIVCIIFFCFTFHINVWRYYRKKFCTVKTFAEVLFSKWNSIALIYIIYFVLVYFTRCFTNTSISVSLVPMKNLFRRIIAAAVTMIVVRYIVCNMLLGVCFFSLLLLNSLCLDVMLTFLFAVILSFSVFSSVVLLFFGHM